MAIINGNSTNETLPGTAEADTIDGKGGNDTLLGFAGNDTLDGGSESDAAVYFGTRSLYTITAVPGGHTISSSAEGIDSLTSVEFAQFSDQTIALSSITSDTTPPTVTSFFPADEATGVQVASNIVVTCSEAIHSSIVFFDSQVAQHAALCASLPADIERVVLDPHSDGLAQMGLHLLGRTGLEAIHIVSHGCAGAVCLGNAVVSSASIVDHAHWLRAIGQALAPGGDILLYGCSVASGEVGQSFISSLAALTGTSVAGSAMPTGASARGGDAALEACVGPVQARPLFTQASLDRLDVLLGTLPSTLVFNSGGWAQTSRAGDIVLPGNITSTSQVDRFEFVPNTSGSYTFSIPGSSLDAMFRVYGSNGNPITPVVDGFGAGGAESVTLNLTEGSWVQFAITGFNTSTGSYTMNVNGPDAIAPALNPPAPTFASSWQAAIGNQGDIDYWHLTAPAGTSSLNVTVSPTGFNSRIMLVSSDNVVQRDVSNGGIGVADTIVNFPVTPGLSFYLAVDSTDRTGVGEYLINLDYNPDQQADFGDPPATITPSTGTVLRLNPFGDITRSGNVSAPAEFTSPFTLYQFHVESPGNHVISVSGSLDTQLRVYNSSGAAITGLLNSQGAGGTESTTLNLGSTEWVYVAVGGFQTQTGAFSLSINGPSYNSVAIPTPASTFVGTASGDVNVQGDVDYWSITAPAGSSSLNLRVTPSSNLDTLIELYNSSGVLLQTIDSPSIGFQGNGVVDIGTGIAITAGNSYFVGVSSNSRTQTGSYTVSADFNPDQADTTPPTVTSFFPADESTGVNVASNIVVTFSEPIKAGSGNIVLRDAAGNAVQTFAAATAAQLSYSGQTLTIDPSANLAFLTGYRVDFDNGSVKDLAGNNYAGTTSYNFTTTAAADTTAPTAASFSPTDEAAGVAVASNIVVTFNEAIQRGTGTIVLRNAAGTAIETYQAASAAQIGISGSVLTLNPSADLAAGAGYRVDFDFGSVKDLAGNSYAGTTSYNFTTAAAADTSPPTVQSFSPADEASGVAVAANIVVNFSEAIQRGTGTIVLRNAAGTAIETFQAATAAQIGIAGSVLTLNPSADLAAGAGYRVDFDFGSVKDLAGNSYAGTTSYNFTTVNNRSTVPTPGDDLLTGTDGADTIDALAGNDIVNALGGDDRITGGPGADIINGGSGSDTALYAGVPSDYLLSRNSQGVVTVSDRFGVMDTLTEVEFVQIGSDLIPTSGLGYLPAVTVAPEGVSNLVFRFYNTRDKAFFYTSNPDERDLVLRESTDPSYTPENGLWPYFYQGTTFEQAHSSGGAVPVYRFYNFVTGHHFFTVSQAEAALVEREATDPSYTPENGTWPFWVEGPRFQAYENSAHTDAQPVFRFYSPGLNRHFFTSDRGEANEIRLTGVWNDEGIAFYGEVPG